MPPLSPPPARDVLDRHFLDMRAKLLELAALFDRLDRGGRVDAGDPRFQKVLAAVDLLKEPGPDRAERVQLLFSQAYESGWLERAALRR